MWQRQDRCRRGTKLLTGVRDPTCREEHPTVRLLDLVSGRGDAGYKEWLRKRGQEFRGGIVIATLDPLQEHKNAIDD